MRWIFLFVLSLNLAYIAWEVSESPSQDYAEVAALKNVETIVLLSESKQREVTAESEQAATDPAETKNHGINATGEEAEAEAIGVSVLAGGGAETVTDAETAPESNAPSEAISPETPVTADANNTEVIEEVPAGPAQAPGCYTMGPFRDLDQLRGLTREIKSYVIKTDFRGSEEKEPTLYWVYLEPEKSRKMAVETGKRLQAKKIKDFYVIREGAKENGLSLGHFRNKDRAYNLAKKVTAHGFNVNVEPVFKSNTVYWLDYQLSDGAVIPEAIFDQYTKSSGKEKISRRRGDCGV